MFHWHDSVFGYNPFCERSISIMDILIVTTSYPRRNDDMSGIFIKRLATAMFQLGSQITVLAPGDQNSKSEEVDGDVRVVRFSYAPRPWMKLAYGPGGIPENLKRNPLLYMALPFFIISFVFNILRISRNCDIIHANWMITGLLALPSSVLMRIPLVVTLRGSDFKTKRSRFLQFVLNKSNAVTTVNEKWMKELKQKYEANIYYTPNGVCIPEGRIDVRGKYKIGKDQTLVLFVGTLCERKGIDILVSTAALLAKNNIRFLVVGPGDQNRFHLLSYSNIILAGEYKPEEVLTIYSSCDIFLLPSRFEGRPNTLIEAMAAGIPSIVAPLPGVIDFFTTDCGIILEQNIPELIADKIISLADQPGLRKKMGKSAKERIVELKLDWNTCAKNYLSIFGEFIDVRYRRNH